MDLLGFGRPEQDALPGKTYLEILHKYLRANLPRLAPSRPASPSVMSQGYTLLTLGLDPSSAPLSRSLKVPLTLGFGTPVQPKGPPPRPLSLKISPDRLLYLLLRWQSLPQGLSHVGRTDIAVPEGLVLAARGDMVGNGGDADSKSMRSWEGSMRSVSLGSADPTGWFRRDEMSEDQLLLSLYSIFTVLPAISLHPPKLSEKPIADLVDAGGYTQLGGIDVRVPLDVLRNLHSLELDGYDPRGLLIPLIPGLRSLSVKDVTDADDWIEELVILEEHQPPTSTEASPKPTEQSIRSKFPNLQYFSLRNGNLLNLPLLPLSNLSHLDLSHNLLNSLPSTLSHLHNLTSLNLSHNMIRSLRNAPSVLGNIATLNLSHNRIDCLVGLERVLGLKRVDLRTNQLSEIGEVGRLAVLPLIKEVWCSGNGFDSASGSGGGVEEDWRVELGIAFAHEGKSENDILVDDRVWSWTEKRRIEAGLASRGIRRKSSTSYLGNTANPAQTRTSSATAKPESKYNHDHHRAAADGSQSKPHVNNSNGNRYGADPTSSSTISHTSEAGPSRTKSPPLDTSINSNTPTGSTPSAGAIQKKRRPRRVINLDSEDRIPKSSLGLGSQEDDTTKGGSMRLPKTTKLELSSPGDNPTVEGDEELGIKSYRVRQKGSKGPRKIDASVFEPPVKGIERMSLGDRGGGGTSGNGG